jgi:hypothetical protein
MAELRREDPLFDRVLPIHLKYDGAAHSLPSNLVFRILRGTQPAQAIGQSEAVYHFEVSDNRDPYFLYYFEVGEGEFPQFKREQSILVEFHAVPIKLMELLEHCLRSAGKLGDAEGTEASDKEISVAAGGSPTSSMLSSSHLPLSSTYTAELDTASGVFSIVEANQFNKLVHIRVPLKLGDDAAIKLYLASRLALSLSQTRRLRMDVAGLERRREEDSILIEQQRVELGELRTQKNVDLQSMRAGHSEELALTQRQHLDALEDMRARHEELLGVLKKQLADAQKELHDRSISQTRRIAELESEKSQVEFKLQDTARLGNSAAADRDRLMQECEELHARRRGLEEERTNLLREIAKSDAKIEGLHSQLLERDASMQKSQALQRAAEEAKRVMEERVQMEVQRSEEMSAQLVALQSEADRFQALATRLQNDNRTLKDRFRDKNDVLRKQETLVNDLRSRLTECETSLQRETDAKKRLQAEKNTLEISLSEARQALQDAQARNAHNEDVIKYLSDEMHRLQLGERLAAEPALPRGGKSYPSGSPTTPASNSSSSNSTSLYNNTRNRFSTPQHSSTAGFSSSSPETVLNTFSSTLSTAYTAATSATAASSSLSASALRPAMKYRSSPDAISRDITNSTSTTPGASLSSSYLERGARRLGLEQDLRLAVASLQLDSTSSPTSEEPSLLLSRRKDVNLDQVDYYNTATVT